MKICQTETLGKNMSILMKHKPDWQISRLIDNMVGGLPEKKGFLGILAVQCLGPKNICFSSPKMDFFHLSLLQNNSL